MKLIALLLGMSLGVSIVTGYTLYKLTHTKDRDIKHLDLKFGTPPAHPEYYPIVHLANSEGKPFCTAFVIDANYAATAGHCLEDGKGKLKTETFKLLDDKNVDLKTDAKAVGYDEWTDFGLLLGRF